MVRRSLGPLQPGFLMTSFDRRSTDDANAALRGGASRRAADGRAIDTIKGEAKGPFPGLAVDHLSHRYGAVTVVDDVSFQVPPGEVHCLMGPSGCGKTTTLRLVAGLEKLQAGTIDLAGRRLADPSLAVPPEARQIGLMFQDLALFPHLTIAENVAFGLRRLTPAERRARAHQLIDMVGMARHSTKYPSQLSGGEQQRIALARALAPRPRLMLLDEAFSALDASLRAEIRGEALHILKEAKVPTLLVTHDPEEAIVAGDRVHVMQEGRLVQSGPPDALYKHPANEFVANFFGPTVRFEAKMRGGLAWTPLGMIAAPVHADGTPVSVVFRAEAVQLRPDYNGTGHAGQVVACRRMGPACDLSIKLETGSTIRVRKPIETPHHIGMRMGIDIDQRYTFVFRHEDAPSTAAASQAQAA
jgi:iron(III) transport system ATP-binding protein